MYKIFVDGNLICDSRIDELAIIDPVIQKKVNVAGSFTFKMAPNHPFCGAISRRKSIITVLEEEEIVFQGIAVQESKDFFNQASYVCEGELTYFNDSIQRQAHYQNLTARQLLEAYITVHNSQVEDSKKFAVGMVTVTKENISCYTNMEPTIKALKEDLVDDFGGYIRIRYADDKKYIDYLAESPKTAEQIIELGKNLIDFTSNIDSTDIATAIIPLGARLETPAVEGLETRLDIKSVNDGLDYVSSANAVQNYGWITKVVTWDGVNTPSILKARGEEYLSDIQFENVTVKASAIDFGMISDQFDRFNLLDQIRVVSEPHGMDRYFVLTEQTLNLNAPDQDTIVLGKNEKLGIVAKTSAANSELLKAIEQAPTSTDMMAAIANATALMRGADGGHVLINTNSDGQPYEILIMDTEDVATATKVWRWNQNGLGYSSNGYEGDYGLAMTIDGAIVADRITSGTLSCDRLNGGTIRGQNIEGCQINVVADGSSERWIGITYAGTYEHYLSKMSASGLRVEYDHPNIPGVGTNANYGGAWIALTDRADSNKRLIATKEFIEMQVSGSRSHMDAYDMYTTGTKSRIAFTENYDLRRLYCYEMPTPIFGDMGEAQLDSDGICYVFIDDIFGETIDIGVNYQVFVQKYGEGELWIERRESTFFVVKGSPGLQFGWELKAVQKDYDGMRLEQHTETEENIEEHQRAECDF